MLLCSMTVNLTLNGSGTRFSVFSVWLLLWLLIPGYSKTSYLYYMSQYLSRWLRSSFDSPMIKSCVISIHTRVLQAYLNWRSNHRLLNTTSYRLSTYRFAFSSSQEQVKAWIWSKIVCKIVKEILTISIWSHYPHSRGNRFHHILSLKIVGL